jgi:hypothetical protein
LPHSDIPGSQPAGDSPGLIAAIHVLHRLLVPRHPPCALASSTSRSLSTPSRQDQRSQKDLILCLYVRPSTALGIGGTEPVSVCSTTLWFFRCVSCLRSTSAFERSTMSIRSRAPVVAPLPWCGSSRHDRLPLFLFTYGHKKGPTSVEPHMATASRHNDLCDCRLQLADDPDSPRLLSKA